ncbi:MAG: MarR family transcriptional regulator [Alkalicoccus sp.]|nr:MAG: MarR family transcriptional regulator [Alkalicoccus sp.]
MGCVMDNNQIKQEVEQHIVDFMITLQHEFGSTVDAGLSPNQQLVLYLIGTKKVCRVKELASCMNVSASAVSQMMAKLDQLKLVERCVDEENRRNTVLRLLPEGEKLLGKMEEQRHTIMDRYLSDLSEKDLKVVHDVFSNLQRQAEENSREGETT